MPRFFVTHTGRRVPDEDTDQPNTEMLIRTVSRNMDGTPRDRPTVCIAPELTGGKIDAAQAEADELDRRGYLPPEQPMTREEHARLTREHNLSGVMAAIVWDVCGLGLTISLAAHRQAKELTGKYKNIRVRVQRTLKSIGWGGEEQNPAK